MTKKRHKRGHLVAVLLGFEEDTAIVWKVFSKVAKHERTLHLNGYRNNTSNLYNFHEEIINALRPTLKEGVRSVILASPARTNYTQEFIQHVYDHHKWLTQTPNKMAFTNTTGLANTPAQVAALTKTPTFRKLICETTAEETENLIEILEKRLNDSNYTHLVLFSLEEAENLILRPQKPDSPKPEYLMITDKYLTDTREKNRCHRLLQVAANQKVKTRIIDAESPAGARLTQLSGFVCLAQPK
jgi:stalled ribosome rescue protein Dom34